MTVPITIVAGFLGAGKTTLINHLLAVSGERLGVLVNDFAALNIDAELIAAIEPGRIALTNGCVCCTIRDDLVAAALELATGQPALERIILETSGVADPFGVMEAFLSPAVAGRLVVESTVCVVDADQFSDLDFASGELAIDQAAVSDFVLLNKCDLVDEAGAEAVETVLLGAQPAMRIIRTSGARLPWEILLGTAGHRADRPPPPAARMRRHDEAYASWTWQSTAPIDLADFRRVVAALPRGVLRAKGVLQISGPAGGRAVFHLVGKRSNLSFEPSSGGEGGNRLALIGLADGFPRQVLTDLFADLRPTAAAVTHASHAHTPSVSCELHS